MLWLILHGVFGLEQRIGHQLCGVLVRQTVEDTLADLPGRHHPCEAQLREMLRDRCRGFGHFLGQLTNGYSRSRRAKTIRTLVGSANMEKTSTARSM